VRNVNAARGGFAVLENAEELQTATMILEPGGESGPFGNEHAASEQAIFVVEGIVDAEIGDERIQMRAGDSAIVPKNAPHRFANRSTTRAVTFNVYAPKAY